MFNISPDGTDVHIDSYINGLGHREEFPGLFRVLEKMFLLSLPYFEKTTEQSIDYDPQESPSGSSFGLCGIRFPDIIWVTISCSLGRA